MKTARKFVLFLAVCVFCTVCCFSSAEESVEIPAGMEKKEIRLNSEILSLIHLADSEKGIDLSSEDKVTVNGDGSVRIDGVSLSMTILPPFGWVVLTQDVLAQLDTYLMITDDIEGLLNALKNSNTHAYTLDLLTMSSAEFHIEQDALSALFGNLTEVDQNYYPAIEDVMKDSYGADGISVMEAGNNRFFKMTVPYQGKTLIVYSTFFNDHTIDIMCYPAEDAFSDYDIETIETMLADLILS